MEDIWGYGIAALAAYLLGSLNGSLLSSRLFWRDDIRRHGSGNAGATNVLRTHGVKWTVIVALWDVGKGVAAVLLPKLFFPEIEYGHLAAGFFVIIGHVYPVFFRFKGGKGIFTYAAVCYAWDWKVAFFAMCVFLLFAGLTRYVSLGSVCSVISLPVFAYLFGLNREAIGTYIALMLLIVFLHRSNIKRLLKGTENKFGGKKPAP